MNLLPKTREEFALTEYWTEFFEKRGEEPLEWYGEFLSVRHWIRKYIQRTENIAIIGCDNLKFAMDMYFFGFQNITIVEDSLEAVEKMMEIIEPLHYDMKILQMDTTAITLEDESYCVVVDRGTLDALFVDDTEETKALVDKYLQEIIRTLRNGGRFVCISLLEEHVVRYLLDFIPRNKCMLRIVHCSGVNNKEKKDLNVPVFIVVATKLKNLTMEILEYSFDNNQMDRFTSTEELFEAVYLTQKAAMLFNSLARSIVSDVTVDLYRPAELIPRYTVHIVDQPPAPGLGRYGAFIAAQGREVEWLFATPAGRRSLQAETIKYQRLVVIILHRYQVYNDLEEVKNELRTTIKGFTPTGCTELLRCLTDGSDIGKRLILISGFSNFCGNYCVEEVEVNNKILRRLIFHSNPLVVQSEALVKIIGNKNRKKIDFCYLASQHHLFMSVAVQLATTLQNRQKNVLKDVLVIGLSGGILCNFIHSALQQTRITAVEIDPIMLEVAEQYFEVKQDKRFHVIINDGLTFVEKCHQENKHFDAIIFDVDSKDLSLGLSCHPRSFLAPEVLEQIKEIIGPKGLLILNLVCRDESLRTEAMANLHNAFPSVCSYKFDEEFIAVVYCANDEKFKTLGHWKKQMGTAGRSLNGAVRDQKLSKNDVLDVADFLSGLNV